MTDLKIWPVLGLGDPLFYSKNHLKPPIISISTHIVEMTGAANFSPSFSNFEGKKEGIRRLILSLMFRESASFSALRPNDGFQKFGPSLGSEIRFFTPKITENPQFLFIKRASK